MATVASAITYARQKAQTDSNGISDTNGLAWANNGLVDITRDLIARGIDAAQTQESYTTLTTPAAGATSTFAWPSDMFALKTIEVDFTGVGGQNYIQARKLDVANLQNGTSFDFVRINQPTSDPYFTNHGDTGEIFPTVTSSTSGTLVRIYYYLTPTEYTATSDAINYPQSLDYRALGDKILEGYYQSLEKFNVAEYWGKTMYGKKLNDAINILGPQSKQPIKPDKLHLTGWNF